MMKMVGRSTLNKININIRVLNKSDFLSPEEIKDLKIFGAWMNHHGIVDGKRKFDIVLNESRYKKNSKTSTNRIKYLIQDLSHELTHVKQYLKNELFDYVDGTVRYKGKRIKKWEDDVSYWSSPWEVEAYGNEICLPKLFMIELKHNENKRRNVGALA